MLPGIYDAFQHWGEKHQTVWIFSDPHFNDDDLAEGVKGRPSAEEQIRKINAKCGRRDALICLGDVGDIECVRKLRAEYKILIMGNHDAGATNYKRQIIHKIYDQDIYTKEQVLNEMKTSFPGWKITISEAYEFHSPFKRWNAYADNLLFDEVYEGALMIGEKLILSHEPVDIPWAMNLHGHVHDKRAKTDAYHINCCSDVIGYKPINLTQKLKQGISSRITSIHRKTIDKATERKARRSTNSTSTGKNRQNNISIFHI